MADNFPHPRAPKRARRSTRSAPIDVDDPIPLVQPAPAPTRAAAARRTARPAKAAIIDLTDDVPADDGLAPNLSCSGDDDAGGFLRDDPPLPPHQGGSSRVLVVPGGISVDLSDPNDRFSQQREARRREVAAMLDSLGDDFMGDSAKTKTVREALLKNCELVLSVRETRAPKPALSLPLPPELHPTLRAVLEQRMRRTVLYAHQVEAFHECQRGRNVILSTPTGSGKSLAMSLPLMQRLLDDGMQSTAMCFFPLKALAVDQLAKFDALAQHIASCNGPRIVTKSFMGDDPSPFLGGSHDQPHVILCTPDKLHYALCRVRTNANAVAFFRRLRLIIIDEAHCYTSTFGHSMQLLLLRVRNLMAALGIDHEAQLRFVAMSATVGNPSELLHHLANVPLASISNVYRSGAETHRQISVVTRFGARFVSGGKGGRGVETSYVSAADCSRTRPLGVKRASTREANAASSLPRSCTSTFAFWCLSTTSSRLLDGRTVSMVLFSRTTASNCEAEFTRENGIPCRPYYASCPEQQKRETLRLFEHTDEVHTIISSSSLEAGVDFADVGVVILSGFPTSQVSTWRMTPPSLFHGALQMNLMQRIGRAGRNQPSLVVFVPSPDNMFDSRLLSHPDELTTRPVEPIVMRGSWW